MKRAHLVLALLLGAAACEPSGPGPLTATVEGPAAGAVILDVRGTGITGFEDAGDVRVFARSVPATGGGAHRVVVVGTSGERLRFRVRVEDLAGPLPTATVVSAVDTRNEPIPGLTGFEVRISR